MTSVRWSDYSPIPADLSLYAAETLYTEAFCPLAECPPNCKVVLEVGPEDEDTAYRVKEASQYPFVVRLNATYGEDDWRITDEFNLCRLLSGYAQG